MSGPSNAPDQPQIVHEQKVDLSKTTMSPNPEFQLANGTVVAFAMAENGASPSIPAMQRASESSGGGAGNFSGVSHSKEWPTHIDLPLTRLIRALRLGGGDANEYLHQILSSPEPISQFEACFKDKVESDPGLGIKTTSLKEYLLQNIPASAQERIKKLFKEAEGREIEKFAEQKSTMYSGKSTAVQDLGISLELLNSMTPYRGELPSPDVMWTALSDKSNWKGRMEQDGFKAYFTSTSLNFSQFTMGSGSNTFPMDPLAGISMQKIESGMSTSPDTSKDGAKGHFQFLPKTVEYLRYRAEKQERPWGRSININNYDDQIFLLQEYRSWVAEELAPIFQANANAAVQPSYGVLLAVDFASHNGGPGAAKYVLNQFYKSGGKEVKIPDPEGDRELPNFVGNNINSVVQAHEALTVLGYITPAAADSSQSQATASGSSAAKKN